MQNKYIRPLWPRRYRRSDVYRKLVALDRKYGLTAKFDARTGRPEKESVIQDVEIPVERGADFLQFFARDVRMTPVWICPLRLRGERTWPLYPLQPGEVYVNFGFWGMAPLPPGQRDGYYNRRIEDEVSALGGHKSLYSTAFYSQDEFRRRYNGEAYDKLKAEYDADGRLLGLYDKCVRVANPYRRNRARRHTARGHQPLGLRAARPNRERGRIRTCRWLRYSRRSRLRRAGGVPGVRRLGRRHAGSDVRITVRSPVAVSYLAQAPGALGLARAYVSGHLDVDGDMFTALSRLSRAQDVHVGLGEKIRLLRALGGPKVLIPRIPPPPQEVVPNRRRFSVGRMHSKDRDAESISHHYDVSNRFYEWVLGPSMAYTCACYPTADATLEEAQEYKFDLVARKIALKPGMRLLDVGCGWGGMVMHAAREYGVKAIGVTLSEQQALWAQQAIKAAGLEDLAEVRFQDYRDVPETGFDAISSIGITEHIGKANVDGYFKFLNGKLKVGGRMLNHCITRPDNTGPAIEPDGFINRYVFPDGELEGPGYLNSLMNDSGFEIRHQENIREHYSKTLAAWCANLEAHWDEAVKEVGQGTARVWRLYMAGSQLGFDTNIVQLHQILGVKLHPNGDSGMPLRPDWEPSVARAAAKG